MKKILYTLGAVIAFVALSHVAEATITASWASPSSSAGYIYPNLINGNYQAVLVGTTTSIDTSKLQIYGDQVFQGGAARSIFLRDMGPAVHTMQYLGGTNQDNSASGDVFLGSILGAVNGSTGNVYIEGPTSPGDASGGNIFIDGSGNVNGTGNVLLGSRRGNVGVGMTPTNRFMVGGDTYVDALLVIDTADGIAELGDVGGAGNSTYLIVDDPNHKLYANGNFGIGETGPANKLDVAGSEAVGVDYTGSAIPVDNSLVVEGSVGVGTTSPGTKFSVQDGFGNFMNYVPGATSTQSRGFNIKGGCYAINGTCTGGSSISGGTAGMITAWLTPTSLTATGTPTATAYYATTTNATSTFKGGFVVGDNAITSTVFTVGNVSSLTDDTINYGAGNYPNGGYDHQIKVYAYKNTGGVGRVYSATPLVSPVVTDNGANDDVYYISWAWSAVAGADGYKVLDYDTYNGYNFDAGYETVSTSWTDDNDVNPVNSDDVVTPSSPTTVQVNSDAWLSVSNSTGRVGIGSSSPALARLTVVSTTTDEVFRASDQANDDTPFVIKNDGSVGIQNSAPVTSLEVGTFNTSNSNIKTGSMELQPFSINNVFLTDNAYYSGGWKTRATGGAGAFYFYNNEGQFRFSTSSKPAGSNLAWGSGPFDFASLKTTGFGKFAVGQVGQSQGDYTGANFLVQSSVNGTGFVGVGTTSPGTLLSIGTSTNFINLSNTGTSTYAKGINILAGCYAISGTCIGSGPTGSGITNQIPIWTSSTALGNSNIAGEQTATALSVTTSGGISILGLTNEGKITAGGTNNDLRIMAKGSGNLALNRQDGTNVYFYGGGNSILDTFDTSGNLGLGVTPTYKLDVTGSGHFTSFVDAQKFVATSSSATSTFAGGVAVGTTTAPYALTVGKGQSILAAENLIASSTSITVDWRAGNSQLIRTGTSSATIGFIGQYPGANLALTICNPANASAGAITFTGVLWYSPGTQPTQTTTANHCDIWSFKASMATSSLVIFGAQTPY